MMRELTRLAARRLTAAAILGCLPACSRTTTMPPPAPSANQAPTSPVPDHAVTDYQLVGVVKELDAKTGRVVIRHEEIPGFMAAMTMPFTLKNARGLEEVHPGDEIKATLRVEREQGEVKDYELKDLVVTTPAPPRSLTLKVEDGRPQLGVGPQLLQPGDAVPDFAMTDQTGATLKLSELRGHVVALTFIFTRCLLPDFCPRMDRKFADLASSAGAVPERARQIRLLSISFDPEHDTPAVLASHARGLGAEPPLWRFAVASHPELAKVAQPLGLVYGPAPNDDVIHNLVIAVIDPHGRLVQLKTGKEAQSWNPPELLKTMYSQLRQTGK